ncbi:MAG: YkvA family protein [Brevinema sp.]
MKFTEQTLRKQLEKFKNSTLSETQIEKAQKLASNLKEEGNNLLNILNLVKDVLKEKYQLDPKILVILIAAILYVISPFDLIPDFTPIWGWLDDIAVITFIVKQFQSIIQDYQNTVNYLTDSMIEKKVVNKLEEINFMIDKQSKVLWRELTIEIIFFIAIIIAKYFYPSTPTKEIVITFIIIRSIIGITRVSYALHQLLIQINFYQVSYFFSYLKLTKNIHEALRLDMRNFYYYHYQVLIHPAMKFTHKFTAFIQFTPDNEEIFNRIYQNLSKNIPLIIRKKCIQFSILFICYAIFIYYLRYLVQYTI